MTSHSTIKKLTPVLFTDEIEPCLLFWASLGFKRTVEVPEGNELGFVILEKNGVEVMYQSRKSLQKDLPMLATMPSSAVFYLEVHDLDAVTRQVDAPQVFARRKTFYGAEEVGLREPAGNVVIFSMPGMPNA